jgi:hypothetical protein
MNTARAASPSYSGDLQDPEVNDVLELAKAAARYSKDPAVEISDSLPSDYLNMSKDCDCSFVH